jgi:peptidoglycan/LPS O-acetylase OafA/YrhL
MGKERFDVLDGWRGVSILLVLAAHLFPLGPKAWELNMATSILGMAFFFVLSGFLVTHFLLTRYGLVDFLIRRFFRILPLAWLYMTLMFLMSPVTLEVWLAHFMFYGNYSPGKFIVTTSHLWSLCVEIHFYLGMAVLIGFFNKRGLMLIPVLLIAFTLLRAVNGVHYSMITHFRIDEILAGAMLALIYNDKLNSAFRILISRASFTVTLVLLLFSCHPDSGFMCFLRPYFAALLVGTTLFNQSTSVAGFLQNKVLFYIATISFALYVIHPFLMTTWLGTGDDLEKYAKRPLLLAVLFLCAHLSTFYYEQKWISLGKWLSLKLRPRTALEPK